MKIKAISAISLWEPWASLIRTGAKQYETRSWRTDYSGPLLICAAKGGLSKAELDYLLSDMNFQKGLCPLLGYPLDMNMKLDYPIIGIEHLSFGKAIAIADLTECIPVNGMNLYKFEINHPYQALFGDFGKGRYAWKLKNVRAIEPFPMKGKQRLFEVELPEGIGL